MKKNIFEKKSEFKCDRILNLIRMFCGQFLEGNKMAP